MKKEDFIKEYENIYQDNQIRIKELEKRLLNLLLSAQNSLGVYFLSKGFIHENNTKRKGNYDQEIKYYYDPKTKVGIKLETPIFIYLDSEYNSISASVVYKCKNKFLYSQKGVLFFFRKEEPENMYKRFRKYTGKTEIKRMKEFLRRKYPKEMLIDDRSEKIKSIDKNKKAVK